MNLPAPLEQERGTPPSNTPVNKTGEGSENLVRLRRIGQDSG